ncbi:MAG: hypothetical protein R1F52_07880 [Candidatus Nitrosoabyssus spongiisocia]|nr:MAG: hypothetical protein R1F52_07880 [Nitrosopumilaceae archaeon AB1(1)]
MSEKNINSVDSLFHAYLELNTLLTRILLENKSLTRFIQQNLADNYVESINMDNFELDKTEVKKLLLHEIKIGEVFYPSDICKKYGLDLKIVVDVISELKQQGRFMEKHE